MIIYTQFYTKYRPRVFYVLSLWMKDIGRRCSLILRQIDVFFIISIGPQSSRINKTRVIQKNTDKKLVLCAPLRNCPLNNNNCCCCWEPEFDIAQLDSRHDALDLPSTLCIRMQSASCARRGGTCRAMVAVARLSWRHLLLCTRTIGVPRASRVQYCCLRRTIPLPRGIHIIYIYDVWYRVGVVSVPYEQKLKASFCHITTLSLRGR